MTNLKNKISGINLHQFHCQEEKKTQHSFLKYNNKLFSYIQSSSHSSDSSFFSKEKKIPAHKHNSKKR